MPGPRKNTAVLLAGGVGSRVGLAIPKQLVKVAGRPIIEHTLAVLDAHPDVDDIIVLMTPGHLDQVREMVRVGGYRKVRHILEGAESRSHTALRALDKIAPDGDPKVLTHDAVRPLVSPRIISDCFSALDTHGAVDVAIPSRDTIVEVAEDATIPAVLPRDAVRRGQTPQAFRLSVVREAYARAMADPAFEPADECTVVHRYLPEVPIVVVPGDERNMKVTEPIDLFLADKLFQLASVRDLPPLADRDACRSGFEGKTMVVFGATEPIGAQIAALATEYGARVHAVADAEPAEIRGLEALDYVVGAAGVQPRGQLTELTEKEIQRATEHDYAAPILIARESFARLRETHGSMLLFTTAAYANGHRGNSLHSMASAAVVNLTQALADEWAADRVRINCVIRPDDGARRQPSDFARRCLDTLLWDRSGQVVHLRDGEAPEWD